MILFIGKFCTWKLIARVLLSLNQQLNYLEIWSLETKLQQGLDSANGRKPSVSETESLYQAARCCDSRTLVCVD